MKHLLRSTALLGFREVSNHAGFNADQIADKFNLNLDLAERDNQFVLMEDFVKMLEYAARLKNIPDLGLQMSPYHDLSILGPLSLVISNLPTVGQAVVYAAEHIDVMSPTILIETYPDKTENTVSKSHTWISISIDLDKPAPHTQALDVCLGNLHRFLKILAGNHYQLAKVMVKGRRAHLHARSQLIHTQRHVVIELEPIDCPRNPITLPIHGTDLAQSAGLVALQ